jgi:type I restriction enzyme S subunit
LASIDGLLREGDLLFTRYNGSVEYVGACAVVPSIGHLTYPDKLIRVRVDSRIVEPRYVSYAFQAGKVRAQIRSMARTTAGQAGISGSSLKSIAFPVPPLTEQHRIVGTLDGHFSCLDAASGFLKAAEGRLMNIRTCLLEQLLTPYCDRLRNLASLLREPMINGRSVPTDRNGFPVLRLTAVSDGRVDLAERKNGAWTKEQAAPFLVQEGDFFVSRGNGSLKLVGRGALVCIKPDPVAFPDTLIRLRVDESKLSREFLPLVWNSRHVRTQVENSARTTAGIYKINQSILASITLPVPPLECQQQIVDEVDGLDRNLTWVRNAIHAAHVRERRLRASLLRAAFIGKLAPQDSSDEPASELLRRLRAEPRFEAVKRTPSGRTHKQPPPPSITATTDDYQQEELPL